MNTILEPANPFDFSEDEIEELVAEVVRDDPAARVQVAFREERGYGVTLGEVVHIYLEVAGGVGTAWGSFQTVRSVTRFLRGRWRRDRDENLEEHPRPRVVAIYDKAGKPLGSISIDSPGGEPVEEPAPDDSQPRPVPKTGS